MKLFHRWCIFASGPVCWKIWKRTVQPFPIASKDELFRSEILHSILDKFKTWSSSEEHSWLRKLSISNFDFVQIAYATWKHIIWKTSNFPINIIYKSTFLPNLAQTNLNNLKLNWVRLQYFVEFRVSWHQNP